MEVNTKLIIIARDYLRGGQAYVLSRSKYKLDIPTIERDNLGAHLRDLLTSFIKLDIHWVNPQLLEVDQPSENVLDVYYCGMIPYDTVLNNEASWMSVDLITNEDVKTQKLVLKAVNTL